MAFMIFQAFGVPISAIEWMLRAIENMIFSYEQDLGI
jgi:hypothetical protein